MNKKYVWLALSVLLFSSSVFSQQPHASEEKTGNTFFISGTALDTHNEPVKEARIRLLVNGRHQKLMAEHKLKDEIETSSLGTYQAEFNLPSGQIKTDIQLEVSKTSFRKITVGFTKNDFAQKGHNFYIVRNIEMPRILGPAFYISTIVFILAYILISFELLHRTLAAMLGATIMLIITYTFGTINPDYRIISFERAMGAIDMNVVFLLMGMMIIVGILKHTGVFQWCAYKSFQIARGKVMILSMVLMTFTAISSAFLDNVTTMLLLTDRKSTRLNSSHTDISRMPSSA